MQSIQTSHLFSLSSVKPLEGLLRYRDYCLQATKKAFATGTKRRGFSPIDGSPLELCGEIEGLEYVRCSKTGSLFLADLPAADVWSQLLLEMSQYRHSPNAFHTDITKSRQENVFEPKLQWIQNTLRLHEMSRSRILEMTSPPSDFTRLLQERGDVEEVCLVNEMECVAGNVSHEKKDAAIFLESLDRVNDPVGLLKETSKCLRKGGLLFVTALVASGFDMTLLGLKNAYLYPPDRANCFTLEGLKQIITNAGFHLKEVSTPGMLDVEIVKSHLAHHVAVPLSSFEKQLLASGDETQAAFQAFLQQSNMSSFARIVATK